MSVIDIEQIVCGRCGADLDVEDNFCRLCGAATREEPTTEWSGLSVASMLGLPSARQESGPKLRNSRVVVLVMLFAVLGPLAFPMLWRSSQFSRAWKITLTVLVVAVTALLVWLLCWTARMTLAPLREMGGPSGF